MVRTLFLLSLVLCGASVSPVGAGQGRLEGPIPSACHPDDSADPVAAWNDPTEPLLLEIDDSRSTELVVCPKTAKSGQNQPLR